MNKKIAIFASLGLLAVSMSALAGRPQDPSALRMYALHGRDKAVYFKGQSALVNGQAVITLPECFEKVATADGRTVQLTCKGGWSPLWAGPVAGGTFSVGTTQGGNPSQEFWWQVTASVTEVPDPAFFPGK